MSFLLRTLLRSLENPPAECQLPCSQETPDKLVLLFRVSPTKGLGPRLLSLANSSSPSTPLLLDGPYGGLAAYNRDFSRHDVVILIAGGAGISACTSVLEELGGRIVRGEPGVRTTRIMLWWMVRDESEYLLVDTLRSEVRETLIRRSALGAKEWVEAQLTESTRYLKDKIDLRLFVTGETDRDGVVNSTASFPSLDAGDEKLEIEEEKPVKSTWSVYGRPFFLARGLFQPSSHATRDAGLFFLLAVAAVGAPSNGRSNATGPTCSRSSRAASTVFHRTPRSGSSPAGR